MEVLAARYVLPIASEPIFQGAIAIDDGHILAVGTQDTIREQYPDAPYRKFEEHVIMPGLVNAYACLDLGLYDPEDIPSRFIEWQVKALAFRQSTSAVKRRGAILDGLQRALSNGTTTVADTSKYEKLLDTVREVGVRLMIAPELTGSAETEQKSLYDDSFRLIDQVNEMDSQLFRTGLAPHSAYALSRHLLKIVNQQAKTSQVPILIQAATSFAEMEFFYESKGEIAEVFFPKMGWTESVPPAHRKTPIQFLASNNLLDERTALIGCSHLSETDLEAIISSHCKVVHCPSTARHFDLGLAPVRRLHEGGTQVALGTGALGASTQLSLWDTMRAALQTHGEVPRESLQPLDILRMATLDGARALHWDREIGSLESGKQADIIVVATGSTHPIEEIPLRLINETTPSHITKVYVGGECLK